MTLTRQMTLKILLMKTAGMEKCILVGIDRDGTIIRDSGTWPGSGWPDEVFELRPFVIEGLKLLRSLQNARIVVVTNQGGVALGRVKGEHLPEMHEYLNVLLKKHGLHVDGCWHCEHIPEDYARKYGLPLPHPLVFECKDRKPGIGMLEKAARSLFGKELSDCVVYVIGDRDSDVLTGINAGGKGVFVPGDYKREENLERASALQARYPGRVFIASDFLEAARWVVNDLSDS